MSDETRTPEAPATDAPDAGPAEAPRPRTAAATEARRQQAAARRAAAEAAEAAAPADPPPPDDVAPRRTRRKRRDAGKPRAAGAPRAARNIGRAAIRTKIAELTRMVGGLAALADEFDGRVIIANADNLADAWAPIIERHPRMRVAISGIEQGGVYGAAILATATVALPILAHHGMLPMPAAQLATIAGVPMPPVSAAPQGQPTRPAPAPPPPAPVTQTPAPPPTAAPSPGGGPHMPPRVAAATPFPNGSAA